MNHLGKTQLGWEFIAPHLAFIITDRIQFSLPYRLHNYSYGGQGEFKIQFGQTLN